MECYIKSCNNCYCIPIYSCSNGTEPDECDDKVDKDAQKPTSCGKITDINGNTHTDTQNLGVFGCFEISEGKKCTILLLFDYLVY